MRFEPSGTTNDADIRVAKSLVDYIFRWMGKKFLDADTQQELGIMSPEVKARLAQAHSILDGETAAPDDSAPASPPGQRRSSMPGRTPSSAPSAAAAWCAPARATRAGTAAKTLAVAK
jgi:ribonucleoside-diphosphate reductase alpha chain